MNVWPSNVLPSAAFSVMAVLVVASLTVAGAAIAVVAKPQPMRVAAAAHAAARRLASKWNPLPMMV